MVLHDYFRHGDAFNLNAKFDTCEYCNKEIRKDRKKDLKRRVKRLSEILVQINLIRTFAKTAIILD